MLLNERARKLLFQRMNDRRNVIAERMRGPLVLCMPPKLEVAFSHEAPDSWSIRSSSVTLAPAIAEARTPSREPERRPLERTPRVAEGIAVPNDVQEALREARERAAAAPEDPWAKRALWIQLTRLGAHEEERGLVDHAQAAYEEALEIARWLVEHDRERLRDLSITLDNVGDVHRARGDLARALAAYEESLAVRRLMLSRDPDRPDPENIEWVNRLASAERAIKKITKSGSSPKPGTRPPS